MILEIIIFLAIIIAILIFARHLPELKKRPQLFNTNIDRRISPTHKDIKVAAKTEDSLNLYQKQVSIADKFFSERNFSLAEEAYLKLVALNPNDPKIYNRLGALYLEQKNFHDAKSAFTEAIKRDNKIASRWYNLGLACLGLQEYRNAIDAFGKAVTIEKKNKKYAQTLAKTRLQLGKFIDKK